jgi:hypothetical protein
MAEETRPLYGLFDAERAEERSDAWMHRLSRLFTEVRAGFKQQCLKSLSGAADGRRRSRWSAPNDDNVECGIKIV